MLCLGIEGTAHTLGIGLIEDEEILVNVKSVYTPKTGGIHPTEASLHHKKVWDELLCQALGRIEEDIEEGDLLQQVDIIAYSAGPGLPPCLRATLELVRELALKYDKPLIPVNHCIAHIEIGRLLTGVADPITLYVSGGNTQILAYAAGRYRVFGETLDVAIGNAIDTFIREIGKGFPGGPIMEKLAKRGSQYIELPYIVKGMDLSFSGIVTAALKKFGELSKELNDVAKEQLLANMCYSFQETCYAMLTEVTERCLAHVGKSECLLTGGVAASTRLQEMLRIMCNERNARFYVVPIEFAGDNGAMIAYTGLLGWRHGQPAIRPDQADFNSKWRADEVEILWR